MSKMKDIDKKREVDKLPTIFRDKRTDMRYVRISGKKVWLTPGVNKKNLLKYILRYRGLKKRKRKMKAKKSKEDQGKKDMGEITSRSFAGDLAVLASQSSNKGVDEDKIVNKLKNLLMPPRKDKEERRTLMLPPGSADAKNKIKEVEVLKVGNELLSSKNVAGGIVRLGDTAEGKALLGKLNKNQKEQSKKSDALKTVLDRYLPKVAQSKKTTSRKFLDKMVEKYDIKVDPLEAGKKLTIKDLLLPVFDRLTQEGELEDPGLAKELKELRRLRRKESEYNARLRKIEKELKVEVLSDTSDEEESKEPPKKKKDGSEELEAKADAHYQNVLKRGVGDKFTAWRTVSETRRIAEELEKAREEELEKARKEEAKARAVQKWGDFSGALNKFDKVLRMRRARAEKLQVEEERRKELEDLEAEAQAMNSGSQLLQIDPDSSDDDQFTDFQNDEAIGQGRTSRVDSQDGLSTSQIDGLMSPYPDYLGCIGSDQVGTLDIKPKSRLGFVMNLDPSHKKGSHWIAVYADGRPKGDMCVEYYDSLADPPSRRMISDAKIIAEKLGAGNYLKFKVNKIADQDEDTANCGYFACKFLIDRFRGKSFAEASGYNSRAPTGERNIEAWKRSIGIQPFRYLSFSPEDQDGEGFRDIVQKGIEIVKKGVQRVKDVFEGVRKNAPPTMRRMMEKYGETQIVQLKVCRKPIFTIIEKLANLLSLGKYEENKSKFSYDRMFHLFMVIKLSSGEVIKIEKNHVVEIGKTSWEQSGKGLEEVTGEAGVTLNQMVSGAEKLVGPSKLWVYDARSQNCQFFIQWLLKGCGRWTPELEKFVMQNAAGVLKDMDLLGKAARVVTDVAGIADVAMQGAGGTKKKKRRRGADGRRN